MKQFQHYLIERRDNNRAFYSHLTRDLRPLLRDLQRCNECTTTVLFIQATTPNPGFPLPEDLEWEAAVMNWGQEHTSLLREYGATWKAIAPKGVDNDIPDIVQHAMHEGSVIIVLNRGDGVDLRLAIGKQIDVHQTVVMPHYYRRFIV